MFARPNHLPTAASFPLRVFALVMSAIFAVEGAIMIAMPALPAWTRVPVVAGLLDATVLSLVTAPAVWWLAVVPIRRLFEARGELVHRLFRAPGRRTSTHRPRSARRGRTTAHDGARRTQDD